MPDQAPALAETLRQVGIGIVGAGCPDPARAGLVASALGCEPSDDLRQVLTTAETDMVLLGDPGQFGAEPRDADLDALRAAHARNVCVATLEPIPATASGIAGTRFAEALHQGILGSLAHFTPLLRHRPIIVELSAVLETYAPVRSAALTFVGPRTHASLGARLFNILDLTRWLIGVPSVIEAAFVSPSAGRGMHPLPGQTIRDLHGEITMNLRFSDGRCAAVYLSDQAHNTDLRLTLASAEGQIHLDRDGFAWTNADGKAVDTHDTPEPSLNDDEGAMRTELAEQCAGVAPARPPIDYPAVLSMTHAALLSTRTGQGESPHDIEQLMLSM